MRMILAALGFGVLLIAQLAGLLFVPAFGYIEWVLPAVAAVWALLIWASLRWRKSAAQGWSRMVLVVGQLMLIAVQTCWLGLVIWSLFCPGGPDPEAKPDPSYIRVVTWNIHCGQDEGLPWQQFDWPRRKLALRSALGQVQPDIICVQEATPEQVAFLEEALPGHTRVGIGRDGPGGEHCAIFHDRLRFNGLGGSTFWLEEPIDQPRPGSAFDVKRICTWVRLQDVSNRRALRVYNTHLYLTETANVTAAGIILKQIDDGDPNDAIILTADFNSSPSAASRQMIRERLADTAVKPGQPTFQLYGIGLWPIDGILINDRCQVHSHIVLDMKPNNIFPSDHFGLLADLELRK